LPGLDGSADRVCQGLVSFGDQLEPANLGGIWQLTFSSSRSIWHQAALGLGSLPGDQLAHGGINRASNLDAFFHAGRARVSL
jgi:hypothetical protein